MDERQTALFLLCTRQEALANMLAAWLTQWAVDICVNLVLTQEDSPETREQAQMIFWDVDSEREELPRTLARKTVLLTGSGEEVLRSYRKHPAGLLVVPLDKHRLYQTMNRCLALWQQGMQWLELPQLRSCPVVPLCSIRYVESEGRGSRIYYRGGSERVALGIGRMEQALPTPPFYRCQNGFMVHLEAVEKRDGGVLILRGEERRIQVSRSLYKELDGILARRKEGVPVSPMMEKDGSGEEPT